MFHLPPGIHFCKQQDFGAENLFIRFLSTLQLTICAALDSKKVSIPLNSTSCHSSIKKNAFRALVTGLSIRLKRSRLTSLVRGSKSTNLGLWQPLNFRPRNGAPKKTHKKCSHRHFTLLTLWDDIQHFSNKIFLPNKFFGIHLSFKLFMDPPCWKISENSLGCGFQPRSFSSLLPARLLMLSRTKLTSTKTRIEKTKQT